MPSRVGDTIFETTLCTLVFRYFDQQVVFFVFVLNRIYPFYFNSKTLFAFKNEPLSSLLKHRYIGYFWKSYLHSPTWHQIATVSLRGPGHLHDEARRAEFTDGMNRWMRWMDGWMGWGYQKCHSMFFILFGYLLHVVYVLIYILSKIFTNIILGFKFWCHVGDGAWGNTIFKITLCSWVFKYLVPNLLFIF